MAYFFWELLCSTSVRQYDLRIDIKKLCKLVNKKKKKPIELYVVSQIIIMYLNSKIKGKMDVKRLLIMQERIQSILRWAAEYLPDRTRAWVSIPAFKWIEPRHHWRISGERQREIATSRNGINSFINCNFLEVLCDLSFNTVRKNHFQVEDNK